MYISFRVPYWHKNRCLIRAPRKRTRRIKFVYTPQKYKCLMNGTKQSLESPPCERNQSVKPCGFRRLARKLKNVFLGWPFYITSVTLGMDGLNTPCRRKMWFRKLKMKSEQVG